MKALSILMTLIGGVMTLVGLFGIASHRLVTEHGTYIALFGAVVTYLGIFLTIIAMSKGSKLGLLFAIVVLGTAYYCILPFMFSLVTL